MQGVYVVKKCHWNKWSEDCILTTKEEVEEKIEHLKKKCEYLDGFNGFKISFYDFVEVVEY